jgi:hypothetical protein
MHHGFGFEFLHGMAENGPVSEVSLEEARTVIDGTPVPLAQIVENSDIEAAVEKLFHANAANVACAARD